MDTGTGYGRPAGETWDDLVRVGPGTPMGELMRRYWQPVGLTGDATTTPREIRVLGEDLILFRDGRGRPGLLTPRCAHRGASLYYGGVEDEGIRCCYHGWLFDTEGRCLEQPCEPLGGLHRDRVRQPWYPLVEYHGLLFTYMGPPERKPVFPVYDVLEDLAAGESVIVDDTSLGGGGPVVLDFNWLQHWENVMDPFHVPILHGRFSGQQFVEEMAIMPEVTFEYTDRGVRSTQLRTRGDGATLRRVTEVIFPNLRIVANPKLRSLGQTKYVAWTLPIDDTHFRLYTLAATADPDELGDKTRSTYGPTKRPWRDLTPEEHQRMPGDYEAQRSQGELQLYSLESLSTTDQGVTMLRRMMRKQVEVVAGGGDPVGVGYDPDDARVVIQGGQYVIESDPAVATGENVYDT